MKLEKINENQIRCTLTSADLADRQLKLSELAYGTEKAKELFQDMMQKAHRELGFEADNIPLMIEAIPVNSDSIVLIITKVEDPEELDTRFSKFSSFGESDTQTASEVPPVNGADDIIDLFRNLLEARKKQTFDAKASQEPAHTSRSKGEEETQQDTKENIDLIRLVIFRELTDVIDASHALGGSYKGHNSLYKDTHSGDYYLVLHQSDLSPEDFNRVCNKLSEFGKGKAYSAAAEAHLQEHFDAITLNSAIQQFSAI